MSQSESGWKMSKSSHKASRKHGHYLSNIITTNPSSSHKMGCTENHLKSVGHGALSTTNFSTDESLRLI
jgi:hypothetical protein